jgi:hypothetical protein
MGDGFSHPSRVLHVSHDGALYAGGSFVHSGARTLNSIARWDGSAWAPLQTATGVGVLGSVRALETFDDGAGPALYVAGSMTGAGDVVATNIARWDGTAWSALGPTGAEGVNGEVTDMVVFDDGSGPALYVAGSFTLAGGLPVSNIARWDGAAWSALRDASGDGPDDRVAAIETFDDGHGSQLYLTGRFEAIGTLPAGRLARWDGSRWSEVGGGVGTDRREPGWALAKFDNGQGEDLFVAGTFGTVGDRIESAYIAKWQGCPPEACRADFDGDGELTIFDFLAFQSAFDLGDPAADLDDDGALTIFDFLEFQTQFTLGC